MRRRRKISPALRAVRSLPAPGRRSPPARWPPVGVFQRSRHARARPGRILRQATWSPFATPTTSRWARLHGTRALICARLYAPGEQRALDDSCSRRDSQRPSPCGRQLSTGPSTVWFMAIAIPCPGLLSTVLAIAGDAAQQQRPATLSRAAARKHWSPHWQPSGILLRPDSRSRREQGLPTETEVVYGEVPQQVALQENGVQFLAPSTTARTRRGSTTTACRARVWRGPGKTVRGCVQLYRRLGTGRGVRRRRRVLPGLLGAGAGRRRGQRAAQPTAWTGHDASRLGAGTDGGDALGRCASSMW